MKKRMRTLRGDLLGKVAVVSTVAVFLAGCSSAVERFGEPPFYTGNTKNQREIFASGQAQPSYQDIANGPGGTSAGLPPASSAPVTTGSVPSNRSSIQSSPLPAPSRTSSAPAAPARTTPVATMPAPEVASAPANARSWKGWTSAGGTQVQVRQGDTLNSISRRYGVPVGALAAVNGVNESAAVRPGQSLIVPTFVYSDGNAPNSVTAGKTGTVKLPPAGRSGSVVTGSISSGAHSAPRPDRKPGEQPSYADVSGRSSEKTQVAGVETLPKRKPAGHHGGQTVTTASISTSGSTAPAPRSQQASGSGSSGTVKTAALPAPALTNEAAPTQPIKTPAVVASVKEDGDASTEMFRWPVRGRIISDFGAKPGGGKNEGVNLAVPEGTAVKAADDGTVIYSGNELKGYGNLILVRHSEGWVTAYAHNSELKVKRGDKVNRGDVVALAGATGSVNQPQLHFEVRKGNKPVDPLKYLPKR